MNLDNRLVYGRKLEKEDVGLNNAAISYHLEKYVEKGEITANETVYAVIGSYETFLQIDKNSISVSPETFAANGNKVSAFFATFELPPLKSGIEKFEQIFENNKSMSNSNVMEFFSLKTVWILLKNCILYLVVLLILLMGLTGIFYCYINNSIRNYSVYELCGMNKFEKKCCISAETLIYTLFSNFIGIGFYYLLLSSDYKLTVCYPHPILIVADICLISLVAVPMSLIQYKKIEKSSIVNKL